MAGDGHEPTDDVIDFLRREAPLELERLQSIACLVDAQARPARGSGTYGARSSPAGLRHPFGALGPGDRLEGAA
jgi:hypothetical protein